MSRLEDKQKIISIIENAIDDFGTKWGSHAEKDNGVEKYAEDILEMREIYAKECSQASLEKAKKDLYNYWIFFEEGKTNSPEFTIKVEDPAKVYNTAYEAYGPQVEDLFYSCVSHEESITNPENIVLL